MKDIPAFPTSHEEPDDYNGHNNSKKTVIDQGMSLRDYFAARALQGMLASGNLPKTMPDADIAECSYNLADAMMEARNGSQ